MYPEACVIILAALCFNAVSANVVCPSNFDFSLENKFCFKIVSDLKNSTDSTKACRKLNPTATLAVIRNVHEQDVLRAAINSLSPGEAKACVDPGYGQTQYFTSGQRYTFGNCRANFVWRPYPPYSGNEILGLNWADKQPDCHKSQENCVTLWLNQYSNLNDYPCGEVACSICQIPM